MLARSSALVVVVKDGWPRPVKSSRLREVLGTSHRSNEGRIYPERAGEHEAMHSGLVNGEMVADGPDNGTRNTGQG